MTSKQNLIPHGWSTKSLVLLGPFGPYVGSALGQHCHEVEIPAEEQLTPNLCT